MNIGISPAVSGLCRKGRPFLEQPTQAGYEKTVRRGRRMPTFGPQPNLSLRGRPHAMGRGEGHISTDEYLG